MLWYIDRGKMVRWWGSDLALAGRYRLDLTSDVDGALPQYLTGNFPLKKVLNVVP